MSASARDRACSSVPRNRAASPAGPAGGGSPSERPARADTTRARVARAELAHAGEEKEVVADRLTVLLKPTEKSELSELLSPDAYA